MISASYRNYNSYSNRNSPSSRQSRHSSQRVTTSSNSNSASSSTDFIYKGANKHHWAKLQNKIQQRLMHENISYIEDEAEVARRSVPPPPAIFLPGNRPRQRRETKTAETSRRSQKETRWQVWGVLRRLRKELFEGHCRPLRVSPGLYRDGSRMHDPKHYSANDRRKNQISSHEGTTFEQIRPQLYERCGRDQA